MPRTIKSIFVVLFLIAPCFAGWKFFGSTDTIRADTKLAAPYVDADSGTIGTLQVDSNAVVSGSLRCDSLFYKDGGSYTRIIERISGTGYIYSGADTSFSTYTYFSLAGGLFCLYFETDSTILATGGNTIDFVATGMPTFSYGGSATVRIIYAGVSEYGYLDILNGDIYRNADASYNDNVHVRINYVGFKPDY